MIIIFCVMHLSLLLSPLLCSLLLFINSNKYGNRSVIMLCTFSLGFSLILAHFVLYDVLFLSINVYLDLGEWIYFYEFGSSFTFYFDLVSSLFVYVVLLISFLVHFYSIFYISQDPYATRFFLYLNLFTWFIILLVLSESALCLFWGWEGIGITSYLLINFWFSKLQSGKSAIKAVVLNRIGDSFFLTGLGLAFYIFGSDDIYLITSMSFFMDKIITKALIICFLLASIAKSAQILLHIWLPDAIEAPTPVSSLLHAATLVGAGVYFMIKLSVLSFVDYDIAIFIIIIGITTSFIAGLIGFGQYDTKRIIAYSTCSQIGLMFYAIGILSIDLSYLHFVIHGVFKCLIFLLAGAFIHTIYNEQDIRKYGALAFVNSFLSLSFFLSNISLLGMFFMAGFYSKEMILISSLFTNNIWSLLTILAIFTTCLYGLKSVLLVSTGFPSWSSLVSVSLYDTNIIVISLLGVLVVLNTFFGPIILEQIKIIDIWFNSSSLTFSEGSLFIYEHVYLNWVIILVVLVFILFLWNFNIHNLFEKNLSNSSLVKTFIIFFYHRFGFDAVYQLLGYKIYDYSYNVCWVANDKGWLITFVYYLIKFAFNLITKINLLIQNGMISFYYISIIFGVLIFFLFL